MATENTKITVQATVDCPADKAWELWTRPEHITKWNSASDDWHTPSATNDLRPGGKFASRMEAKDGSMGFEFGGTYKDVKKNALISYEMGDGRRVQVNFTSRGSKTEISETFDAETQNSVELQKNGWQAILDNFKKYAESHS
jgi:uncharacterized protein YndB with AHSA1/START domain